LLKRNAKARQRGFPKHRKIPALHSEGKPPKPKLLNLQSSWTQRSKKGKKGLEQNGGGPIWEGPQWESRKSISTTTNGKGKGPPHG